MNIRKRLENYLNLLLNIFDSSELENLDLLFERLNKLFDTHGRIFVAGNGGSYAVASHVATDLAKLTNKDKTLSTIHVGSNVSLLTAQSNDDGYENALVNIIKNYNPGKDDILICISSSGNSENILELIDYCNKLNVDTFSLVGFDGGKAKKTSKHTIHFLSEKYYYGPIEDLHMSVFHLYAHFIKKDISEI